jgi:hypothetical protein
MVKAWSIAPQEGMTSTVVPEPVSVKIIFSKSVPVAAVAENFKYKLFWFKSCQPLSS